MTMFREYLAAKGLGILPVLALLVFFTAFLGVLAYVIFYLKRRDVRDRLASLPFDGDETTAGSTDDEGRVPAR
jgi:cbb3-type cytochrome oxidase subunit 3